MAPIAGLDQDTADCAAMVAERNLGEFFLDNASGPAIEEALQKLKHIRLDREKLTSLDSCRYFLSLPCLTNLYLQENELKNLRGLEKAKHLRFLTIAGNNITKLEGLFCLSSLMVLDVSDNAILKINAETELPKSLSFLNIDGNPCCTHQVELRENLKVALPNLKELDGDPVTEDECSDSEDSKSDLDDRSLNGETHLDQDLHSEELTCNGEQEIDQTAPKDKSRIIQEESCASTSPVVQRIGTPSSFKRLTSSNMNNEVQDSQSLCPKSGMGSQDVEALKQCLLQANIEPEFILQNILAKTVGSLDQHTMDIVERLNDRVKNLDVQLSQEIVELFFSPRSSHELTSQSQSALEASLDLSK